MSELFDSLNFNNTATGPSSSQSSSQPSTSKVYWHGSPSPGILQQLRQWPAKEQDSPTLPLGTQAFVGELRKIPCGASSVSSPLVSRSTSRKPGPASRQTHRNTINLLSDDDEDDANSCTDSDSAERRSSTLRAGKRSSSDSPSKRLLLGEHVDSSPESRRRRTMDAGHTGRLRECPQGSWPSASAGSHANTSSSWKSASPSKRGDRRPPRKRKKESFIAGLGFDNERGSTADCLKIFEQLQAAIENMASKRSAYGETGDDPSRDKENATKPDHDGAAFAAPLSQQQQPRSQALKLTPSREGIVRTASAPSPASRPSLMDPVRSQQLQRPQTTQHYQSAGAADARGDSRLSRELSQTTVSERDADRTDKSSTVMDKANAPSQPSNAVQVVRSVKNPQKMREVESAPAFEMETLAHRPDSAAQHYSAPASSCHEAGPESPLVLAPIDRDSVDSQAVASPLKRSKRIEALQQTSHVTSSGSGKTAPSTARLGTTAGRKLGVRSRTASPRKSAAQTAARTGPTGQRSRSSVLPGMSQARQPGLPRNCSQFASSQHANVGASHGYAAGAGIAIGHAGNINGPSAPFRPPARSLATVTASPPAAVTAPAKTETESRRKGQQPSSSDDSFPDEDEAFLALACQLEY
ncbi:hypothetical protein BCV70DRAFT_197112 [Testicularia cyperi]|uniref:Uncharacterized protein n=1 Tax=Testicularia cyperi TaxID=1882483 RepID=A0A317XY45_9BASI|nr:hypothetical protein BCV70DRAFT_197112 [Testicularia cyperi]